MLHRLIEGKVDVSGKGTLAFKAFTEWYISSIRRERKARNQ